MNVAGMTYELLEAHFKAEDERLAREMPDEAAALRVMFDAWKRLKQLGWNDIDYCPKDGSVFDSISAGSTGIHPCHYEGTWPMGSWWVADGGDLWPARPILFRKTNPPAAPASQEHTMDDQSIEQEIQAKGKTAPRVTPADIEAEIVSEHYFTAGEAVAPPVGKMVDRFLGWRLPTDFAPDCGISFNPAPDARGYQPTWPTGTNLLHAGQAKAMFEHAVGTTEAPESLGLLTFCVLTTRNGFTVTGESACASPENFDAEIGRKIARQNAAAKLWPLLGFRLRDQLASGTVAHHPV